MTKKDELNTNILDSDVTMSNESNVISTNSWDVEMPAATNTIKGTIDKSRKHRRISLEIHKVEGRERIIIRILDRYESYKILKSNQSVMTFKTEDDLHHGWVQRYSFHLRNLVIKQIHRNHLVLLTIYEKKNKFKKQTRDVFFYSQNDANEFAKLVKYYKSAQEKQALNLLSKLQVREQNPDEHIQLLFEIVSAWDLKPVFHSDPYVIAKFYDEIIHQTKHISKTDSPIWSIETQSVFLLETTMKDLLMTKDGIMFEVRDRDLVGKGNSFGHAWLTPTQIYKSYGERIELPLKSTSKSQGYIAIRCRRATDNDLSVIFRLKTNQLPGNIDHHLQLKSKSNSLSYIMRQDSHTSKTDGIKRYRCKPEPNYDDPLDTEWLTHEQITNYSKQPSIHWIDAGSGSLGRIYLEIIQCDSLQTKPVMIRNVLTPRKPCTFVSILYEDTAAFTDVIDECSSPRWMPWSKRAFQFRMMHPSSQIFLAVFNYNHVTDHELIGRVSIDISNLQQNQLYHLTYSLTKSAKYNDRISHGTVTVRLRFSYVNQRQLLLTALKPPPSLSFNVQHRSQHNVIRKTCNGERNMEHYEIQTIQDYMEELTDYYFNTITFVKEGCKTVFLWRAQSSISIPMSYHKSMILYLPIHSIISFVIGIILVEYPHYLPSVLFGSVGWMLIATMNLRKKHPNPWMHTKTILEFIQMLILGTNILSKQSSYKSDQNKILAEAYDESWKQCIMETKQATEERKIHRLQEKEEYIKIVNNDEHSHIDDAKILPKVDAFHLLKPLLYPLQQNLSNACHCFRLIRNILYWEESFISFWISLISMILAILFIYIPWQFLLYWMAKICVWTFLVCIRQTYTSICDRLTS